MQIVLYPHPALAHKSVDVTRIDETLQRTVRKMFDLMYAANGIGLAANQVGLPFRFFVINLAGRPGQPDEEHVFINPIIRRKKGSEIDEEGCLSLPGLYGNVRRAGSVVVEAFDLKGQPFEMALDELAARAIQHETDHLDGVMFTDRIREEGGDPKVDIQLPKFIQVVREAQRAGKLPGDEAVRAELKKMIAAGAIPPDYPDRPPVPIDPPKLKEE